MKNMASRKATSRARAAQLSEANPRWWLPPLVQVLAATLAALIGHWTLK
jgi:hypothetical protein